MCATRRRRKPFYRQQMVGTRILEPHNQAVQHPGRRRRLPIPAACGREEWRGLEGSVKRQRQPQGLRVA